MAQYPVYTAQDISDFSGRPVASYTTYSTSALSQALLLFKIGTCLAQFPDDETEADLAKNAVLDMANSIFLAQKYQAAKASPFSSETIGSYSYSKAAQAVSKGDKTGVMWFDLAIDNLSVCDRSEGSVASGGVEVFENDGIFIPGANGDIRLLGPDSINLLKNSGEDPSPGYPSEGVPPIEDGPLPTMTGDWVEDPDHPGLFSPE